MGIEKWNKIIFIFDIRSENWVYNQIDSKDFLKDTWKFFQTILQKMFWFEYNSSNWIVLTHLRLEVVTKEFSISMVFFQTVD